MHICRQLFIQIYTFIHMHICHIRIHMYVIDTYAYICTHIQYTEQTIDYQKPKMCISNYLFFSDGSPRLLLENTCVVTGPVPFSLPHPVHRLLLLLSCPSWTFPVFLTGHCAWCQWRSHSTLGRIPCQVLISNTEGKDGGVLEQTGSACWQEEQADGAGRGKKRGKSLQDPGLGNEGTVFKEREASAWSCGAPKD